MSRKNTTNTKKYVWDRPRSESLLGSTVDEINQTFKIYGMLEEMLFKYCSALEAENDGLNLTLLATAMGMVCNDICQELENEGATDCREHVVGVFAKIAFYNKRLGMH